MSRWVPLFVTVGLAVAAPLAVQRTAPALQTQPPAGGDGKPAAQPPAGPRVQPLKDAEACLELLGQDAFCLRYEGAWVEVWVEVEVDGGKSQTIPVSVIKSFKPAKEELPPANEVSGYIVLARRPRAEKGEEVWDLGVSTSWKGRNHSVKQPLPVPQPRADQLKDRSRTTGLALQAGKEVTLATFAERGKADGPVTRKMVLKCKVLE